MKLKYFLYVVAVFALFNASVLNCLNDNDFRLRYYLKVLGVKNCQFQRLVERPTKRVKLRIDISLVDCDDDGCPTPNSLTPPASPDGPMDRLDSGKVVSFYPFDHDVDPPSPMSPDGPSDSMFGSH